MHGPAAWGLDEQGDVRRICSNAVSRHALFCMQGLSVLGQASFSIVGNFVLSNINALAGVAQCSAGRALQHGQRASQGAGAAQHGRLLHPELLDRGVQLHSCLRAQLHRQHLPCQLTLLGTRTRQTIKYCVFHAGDVLRVRLQVQHWGLQLWMANVSHSSLLRPLFTTRKLPCAPGLFRLVTLSSLWQQGDDGLSSSVAHDFAVWTASHAARQGKAAFAAVQTFQLYTCTFWPFALVICLLRQGAQIFQN